MTLTGADTAPTARAPSLALAGSWAAMSTSGAHCRLPACVAFAATCANGVPKATWAAASWAAVRLENDAAVKQAVSKSARWRSK